MADTFAIVTPSFAPDFERCRLLAESVVRHAADHVHHYIVVDKRDEQLFSQLRSTRTHLVIKQDILPPWLRQVPGSKTWWLNFKGIPVRGWIVQQIVKLSVVDVCSADTILFLDSDTFFVRDYDPRDYVRDGLVPMFREELPEEANKFNQEWHRIASRVLGLPPPTDQQCRLNYVSQLVTWRRSNVLELHHQLAKVSGRPWVEALLSCSTLSEYVLYGVFCERSLMERSRQYFEPRIDTLNYWKTDLLDDGALRKLRSELKPEQVAVMVSAKSHTPVAAIRAAFELAEGVS
ncbi:MAG: DUF6492 family protein [Polyangiaceae bacterium]